MTVAQDAEHFREWPWYDEAAVERCAELLRAGRSFDYYCGPELSELESAYAERTGRRHALSFNSGTSALLAAYVALGIGEGDEVVVPTYTFLATASPLFLLGAVPVLCDSGDDTGNVTASTLRERIGPRTRAIVVTHLWGQPCDMDEILALARSKGLAVVSDCSHAHGSTYRGHDVGGLGDIAVFSLGSHKLISGGAGGILLCDDDEHFDAACLLGHFKQRARSSVIAPERARFADVGLGGNLRMSPTAAVLAASHLASLDTIVAEKERNVVAALNTLSTLPGVRLPVVVPGTTRAGWYGCTIEVTPDSPRSRETLLEVLKQVGVPVSAPQTAPLHLTSVFSGARPQEPVLARRLRLPQSRTYAPGDLPRAERLFDSWIALPATHLHGPAAPLIRAFSHGMDKIRSLTSP